MESLVERAAEAGFSLVWASSAGERGAGLPLVVSLPGRGGDARSALAAARATFGPGPDVVALQPARPCNPFQSGLRSAEAYSGFSWYLGEDPARPEAASFGDALAQVSLFANALARDAVFCGTGQGAALAVALALHSPPCVVGVHATGAAVPRVEGWEAPSLLLGHVAFALRGLDAAARLEAVAFLGARGARGIDDGLDPARRPAAPSATADVAADAAWLQSLADARRNRPDAR